MKSTNSTSRAASSAGVSTAGRKQITIVKSIDCRFAHFSARIKVLVIFRWLISLSVMRSGLQVSLKIMSRGFVAFLLSISVEKMPKRPHAFLKSLSLYPLNLKNGTSPKLMSVLSGNSDGSLGKLSLISKFSTKLSKAVYSAWKKCSSWEPLRRKLRFYSKSWQKNWLISWPQPK